MLGCALRPAPSIWTVAFHCQQGDELTQQSSLEPRKLRGLVSHRRSGGLVRVSLVPAYCSGHSTQVDIFRGKVWIRW
jgi:hypothetical protein